MTLPRVEEQIDWNSGTIYVKQVKKGTPSIYRLYSEEIRALRKLQRDYPASPYVFQSSRHGSLAQELSLELLNGLVRRLVYLFLFMPICYGMEQLIFQRPLDKNAITLTSHG
ncbi:MULTISPECIES: hypothetical protein [Brasilonema]|uniref:hypothetical protein n=1 Tax=Brasilonema TaxID=383614 RepID=UPI001B7D14A0|nr:MULTISPECIES: hypothetical protein [Brasilonema]